MQREGVPDAVARIRRAVATVVVGREQAIDLLLVAVLSGGHALIEDVPGVGKTVLARSLATAMGCSFRRIQATPDLLPSDITGSSVFNQATADFEFRPGPVFGHVLLADEINRATPRAQSALLEAMQERQVTVDGVTRPLPQPFLVLATQNPIELEGTFPLPEAQLDRFLLRLPLGFPTHDEERDMLRRFERDDPLERLGPVSGPDEIVELQHLREAVTVSDPVLEYLLQVVRTTREDHRVDVGCSPRSALALHRGVQAHALLDARTFVLPDDVKRLAGPVLAHRLHLRGEALLRGATAEQVVQDILDRVPVPVEDVPAAS